MAKEISITREIFGNAEQDEHYEAAAAADDDNGDGGDDDNDGDDDDDDVKERAGWAEAVGDLNQQVAPDNVHRLTDPLS